MKLIKQFSNLLLACALFGCNNPSEHPEAKNSNSEIEQIPIYLENFDLYLIPDQCVDSQTIEIPDSNAVLMVSIKDCEGTSTFILENRQNQVLMKGSFSNSLDTLKKYEIGKSAITGNSSVSVFKYFQPLAEGKWEYYKDGSLIKKEIYKNGVMQGEPK